MPDAVHTLLLKARKGEPLEIEYAGLSDEELILFPLAYLRCLERRQTADNRTVFRVQPIADESAAMILCRSGQLTLDAIHIRRLPPEEAQTATGPPRVRAAPLADRLKPGLQPAVTR